MTLAVLAAFGYALLGLLAAFLVWRARRKPAAGAAATPFVSVVVAARNEEATIGECIEALLAQEYPRDRSEVIIVDDGSADATAAVARRAADRDARVRVLPAERLVGHPPGKAAALETGIRQARGEVLLFTDADCRPPRGWVAGMVRALARDGVGAVGGVTRVAGDGLHARLQAIDWTLLKGVAAGWSEAGIPLTAMGNNMGVRREAYEDIGGFASLRPSVTEDYALFQAIGRAGWDVRLDAHPSVESATLAERHFRDVFRQRRRWARGALAASPLAVAFYVIIYAAHLLPLLLLPTRPEEAGVMVVAKMVVDAVVIASASARGRILMNLLLWPLYEVYLYIYLLALPVSLAVVPDITWKDRAFRQGDSGGSAE